MKNKRQPDLLVRLIWQVEICNVDVDVPRFRIRFMKMCCASEGDDIPAGDGADGCGVLKPEELE